MLARTDSRARALVLLLLVAFATTGIGMRLVWWQVIDRERLVRIALEQLARHEEIPAERGEIYDRNGALLATSVQVQSVFATPPTVPDAERAAARLSPLLGMPADDLVRRLESTDPWVWLKRRVDHEVAERVSALDLPGIGMLPETKRVYPMPGADPKTTLAAQLIGFVNVDGAGQYGVEGFEDETLGGEPGAVTAHRDVAGRRIADSVYELREPVDGMDLTLTIDAGVQHMLEQALLRTWKRNKAVGATGVIMDPRNGAIVAMASYPSYDANRYEGQDVARFTPPAIARQYEPGSVIKALTIAAALDAGAITPRDRVHDDNNLLVGNIRIQNADRHWFPSGRGDLKPAEVLKFSNNVGAAKIGMKLGGEKLYEAFRRFGFGSPTGIDIEGEASGVVWNPNGPNAGGELTVAQNAFGQGLSVTAVQLVAGYAAIANGGTRVTPHVVAGWTDHAGEYHAVERPPGERVMSEETARAVLRMLVGAIDDGIAVGATIPGYSVAGKTGTAEIAGPVKVKVPDGVDANGKPKTKVVEQMQYIDGWVDSSFIGVVPASDPQLVTLILIHRPSVWGTYQMGERPEEVYARLTPQVLDYLAIPPDRPQPKVARP
ncbi:MAG TPA: penicillin-binding protein 2 [Candidatus Limnocylindria bacterium]|nr:penicillin-binding protein 2 [Candidatus Limnocylindria bacterium]